MRDAVFVLQIKTKRARKWIPMDVFSNVRGAERARHYQQETYPKLMFRVREFTAGRD